MKKIAIVISALLLSAQSLASSTEQSQNQNAEPSKDIYLSVFDKATEPMNDLKKRELSRSLKAEAVCWVVSGKFPNKVKVVETFKTQAKAKFTMENAKIEVSPNEKLHTITSTIDSVNNGDYVMNCWEFGRWDPLGKYRLTVQVGDQKYEMQSFELLQ